jgi:hypothetical protein
VFYELGNEPQTVSNKLSLEFMLLFGRFFVCLSTVCLRNITSKITNLEKFIWKQKQNSQVYPNDAEVNVLLLKIFSYNQNLTVGT